MKIFVTGITGFFAPYVVRELLAHNHEVVLFSRKAPSEEFAGLECILGDINNHKDCLTATEGKNIDAFVHIAAWSQPSDCQVHYPKEYYDPELYPMTMQTNVMGTYNMLEAAIRSNVDHFILLGSCCVLGHAFRTSGRSFPLRYLPVDENHPSDIEDSYSLSKKINEDMLQRYTRCYGLRTIAVRSGWIFDEKMRMEWSNKAKKAEGFFDNFMPWIAAEDEAVYIRLLLENKDELPLFGAYYCHADDTLALEPSMELIEKFLPEIKPYMTQMLSGHEPFISNQKIKALTGYSSKLTWRTY